MQMEKRHFLIPAFLIMFFLSFTLSFAAEKKSIEIKQSDKCPVCGMFVAKYNNWLAQIVFNDGTYAAFDGPKDMFRYYLDMKKYNPSKTAADISNIFVTEYYSTEVVDARKAFFVQGSDVYGPMGSELIPLASEADAKEFMKDHAGNKILNFSDVSRESLR
jgi:copper chaperone NosL